MSFQTLGRHTWNSVRKGGCHAAPHGTYEKITPSKRDTSFRVPRSAPKERTSIGKEILFHAPIKDDGIQRPFWSRSNLVPLIHRRRGVNRNVFRLGPPPATLGISEKLIDNSRVVAVDPITTSSVTYKGPYLTLNTYCILSVWRPTCAVPCALVLVARR